MDGDRLVAVVVGDHDGLAGDAVGGEDRDLRLVDDREHQKRAERARVGQRERAAGDLVGRQLLGAGPGGEVVDVAGDGPQPLVVGVVDDRGEQALEVEVDRDGQVDVVVHDELAVADRRVHVREVAQRVDHRPGDERQVGEAEALLALNSSRWRRRTRSTFS